ncbi:hypothetical protein [Nocardia sp. NPDC050717]|uniref:hypothetical protein n=1 Tax=Nocardia sp. NPDC050717 TaxID=3157221 RepID=UPI0033F8F0D1
MTSLPRAVLGFCSWTHDSAAALILDGELIGFAEEERLNNTKHTKDYPPTQSTGCSATATSSPN